MKNLFAPTLLAATVMMTACDKGTVDPRHATMFEVTVENISPIHEFNFTGVFNTPVGEPGPGPILAGGSYEFVVHAAPGSYLTFATMFVQSNDWFYAPDGMGIPLWDSNGDQMSGDVTEYLYLWDAGTEVDQEPGLGPDQAPRQAGPNTGADDDNPRVRLADDEWGNVPALKNVIRVTLTPKTATSFRVRIENASEGTPLMTSDGMSHPVILAPGAYVVHSAADPLFTVGAADRGEGLAEIAEDGNPGVLGPSLADRTGITGPISPGAWATHRGPNLMFREGRLVYDNGLEGIAEDGDPTVLSGWFAAQVGQRVVETGVFNTPTGGSGPAPAFPGESYSFEVTASPGQRLSFATMFVQSNDAFFAPNDNGIDLFTGRSPVSGDVTDQFRLWDAGTEVNEYPGVGIYQAPRQPGPNSGMTESVVVQEINDGFSYPDVDSFIRVTITPIG